MSKKYPQYSGGSQMKREKPCDACGTPTRNRTTFKVNWFRGDDESYFACQRHLKEAKENASLFFAAVEQYKQQTKESAP